MSTGTYILRCLTVTLFVLAVCAPIFQQLVDYSPFQIQLVEELPEEEKKQDSKDHELNDKKVCSHFHMISSVKLVLSSCHSAMMVHSSDYSSMPDPVPELV